MRNFAAFILITTILISCSPQTTILENTPIVPPATSTFVLPTATLFPTLSPTETFVPTETPLPVTCAVPLNPTDNATVPASGPFDFAWVPFDKAASYVIAIGPSGWYPTNFPVTGTVLTRYMENFPISSSYEWKITVLDSSGGEICSSGPYTFVTSTGLYATPAFADSGSSQPLVATDSNNQGVNPPPPAQSPSFIIQSVQTNEFECTVSATVSVSTSSPVTRSVMRYTVDKNEAGASDFCVWGSAFGLSSADSSTYQGYQNFSNTYVKNGDTVYLIAMFIYDQGATACSQVIQQTLTTCTGN